MNFALGLNTHPGMYGQYIEDATTDAPLLLLGDVTPSDAAALIAALEPLTARAGATVALHQLAEWHSRHAVRVEALSTTHDAGCALMASPPAHVRCGLRPGTWDQIVGLLAPFATGGAFDGHDHQYLNRLGPVVWIVSTDSTW